MQNLENVIKSYYVRFVMLLLFSFATSFGLMVGILHQYEKTSACTSISGRFNDLNDVFAREIILNSEDTLSFELKKMVSDNNLKTIDFKKDIAAVSNCSLLNFSNSFSYPIFFGNKLLGSFNVVLKDVSLFSFKSYLLILPLGAVLLVILYMFSTLRAFINNVLYRPMDDLLKQANTISIGITNFNYSGDIQEFRDLTVQLNTMLSRLVDVTNEKMNLEKNAEKAEVAAQVAHDIRSPLSALKMITKDVEFKDAIQGNLFRNSVNRIQDIANSLLAKNPKFSDFVDTDTSLVFLVLDEIISEKRIQYRSHFQVQIGFDTQSDSYGLSAKIDPIQLKRIISNLIDNAVESITDSGSVIVSLSTCFEEIVIRIIDTGKGIPSEIINILGNDKITSKSNGNGLGVFSAQKILFSYNGKLTFSSKPDEGTTVKIILKKASLPNWISGPIKLDGIEAIAILDDDRNIHGMWSQKLSQIKEAQNLIIHNFITYESFEDFVKNSLTKNLYLVDFELLGFENNGLDIINKLEISRSSLLVTSRYNQDSVLKKADELNVKILPKNLIEFIPFEKKPSSIVLIDDDRIIAAAWSIECRRLGIEFHFYHSPSDFLNSFRGSLNTNIYIDLNIGSESGEDLAKELHKQGYSNLYYSSGYEIKIFPHFVKGNVGKKMPFV